MEKHSVDEEIRQRMSVSNSIDCHVNASPLERLIDDQIRKDREAAEARGQTLETEFTELKRDNDEDKGATAVLWSSAINHVILAVEFKLATSAVKESSGPVPLQAQTAFKMALSSMAAKQHRDDAADDGDAAPGKRKMSALESIREANEAKKMSKQQDVHTDYWLRSVGGPHHVRPVSDAGAGHCRTHHTQGAGGRQVLQAEGCGAGGAGPVSGQGGGHRQQGAHRH